MLPAVLFLLTCASTFLTGVIWLRGDFDSALGLLIDGYLYASIPFFGRAVHWGLLYSVPLMTILICHEAGHFLQARRYGVHASFPFFLPMPLSPIGTMGAVIVMEAHMGDRKALFDIGITGPLAGLVPTLIFSILGLQWSEKIFLTTTAKGLGEPLIFKLLAWILVGPLPEGQDILLHPMAYAGWVGLLITSLNLFPIGQLDGGHVLYGLLRARAHPIATLVLLGAAAAVFLGTVLLGNPRLMGWTVMLLLLFLMGPRHPPTADDNVPLGFWRHVLGWLTLGFLPLGFTPFPM